MALSVLPTNTELAGMTSLNDVVTWTGLNAQLWNLVSRSFGTIPNMSAENLDTDSIRSVGQEQST